MLATSDEQEHFQNFNKKDVNINPIKPCDAIPSATSPKPNKSENPILVEIRSLKPKSQTSFYSSWKDTFEKIEKVVLSLHLCQCDHHNLFKII